jgi:hypothetical protein
MDPSRTANLRDFLQFDYLEQRKQYSYAGGSGLGISVVALGNMSV